MAGCQVIVIDIKGSRCRVHLIGIDHGVDSRHLRLLTIDFAATELKVRRAGVP
jgi:hypothetical protein